MAPPSPSAMIQSVNLRDGQACLKIIEDLTTHAGAVQRHVIREILAMNAGTDYLRGFLGAMEGSDELVVAAFKERVPVVEYDDIKPYIERIANGAPSSLISSEPITEFLISSGTSGGKQKLMPSTNEELHRKAFVYSFLTPVVHKHIEGLARGKGMYLMFVRPDTPTPSGLVARTSLTSFHNNPSFRGQLSARGTSPVEAMLCPDIRQSMYAQLLCGLARRDEVVSVGAAFASSLLRTIKFLEDHWPALCDDIRNGRVDEGYVADPACREAVSKVVAKPDQALSDAIAAECAAGSWRGILRRLWPRAKYIDAIVTGSMAQCVPLLEFYGGGMPLVSMVYASSECFFGINLRPLDRPEDVLYTLMPNMCYYEFIEVEKDGYGSREGKVVDLADVQVGGFYELVITTFTGLNRYRVGDILQVSGFHNTAPQFRYVHRRNVVLTVDAEKTTEDELLDAVTAAKRLLEPLGCHLSEYTAYADTTTIPGHYVLFWELTPPLSPPSSGKVVRKDVARVMAASCAAVEAGLNSIYRQARSPDRRDVGPLEIRVVATGAFDALMDQYISRGSSASTYKTPRCIKREEDITVLDAHVVGRFFSDVVPYFEPLQGNGM